MNQAEQRAFDAMLEAFEDLELLWHRTRQSECLPMQIVRARAAIAAAKTVSEQCKRTLWDVCKDYGSPGECIFIGFKIAIEKETK